MTLIRILLIALVAWLLLRMIKNWANRPSVGQRDKNSSIESIVRCQQCGLHIPKHEAIEAEHHYYCCQEHQRLQQKEH